MQHLVRILSWTGVSNAHPAAFADLVANDAEQQARSPYFFLFTMLWIPEVLFSAGDFVELRSAYRGIHPSH
jgi:hypothetical protein